MIYILPVTFSCNYFYDFPVCSGQDKAGEGEGPLGGQRERGRERTPGAGPEEGDGAGGGQVQGHRPEQQAEDARRQPRHHQVGKNIFLKLHSVLFIRGVE